jgi:hypothetical protein
MGISKRAKQLKKAREVQTRKLEAKKDDKKRKINEIIDKMDPNMTADLKESKLRLTAKNLVKENLKNALKDGFKKVRSQRKKSREVLSEIQDNQLNEIQASQLFKKMFKNK